MYIIENIMNILVFDNFLFIYSVDLIWLQYNHLL